MPIGIDVRRRRAVAADVQAAHCHPRAVDDGDHRRRSRRGRQRAAVQDHALVAERADRDPVHAAQHRRAGRRCRPAGARPRRAGAGPRPRRPMPSGSVRVPAAPAWPVGLTNRRCRGAGGAGRDRLRTASRPSQRRRDGEARRRARAAPRAAGQASSARAPPIGSGPAGGPGPGRGPRRPRPRAAAPGPAAPAGPARWSPPAPRSPPPGRPARVAASRGSTPGCVGPATAIGPCR